MTTAGSHGAGSTPGRAVTIRPLKGHADLEQAVALQQATWGTDCPEIVPPAVLMAVQKVGGLALGAFDQSGALLGTLFGITGLVDGQPVHWSHMLAVRRDWRDHGIGQRLKDEQRRRLTTAGVHCIRWSFDPLVARNAHVNLHRLGARVLEYVEDMYGDSRHSVTDSIIGSDRLVVEWRPLEERAAPSAPDADTPRITLEAGVGQTLPRDTDVLLEIPRDIQTLKHADPERATAWRLLTRRVLEEYLELGFHVTDFQRGQAGSRGCYVLMRPSGER
jgi:predicted GNAT superfamily acetyltransferase